MLGYLVDPPESTEHTRYIQSVDTPFTSGTLYVCMNVYSHTVPPFTVYTDMLTIHGLHTLYATDFLHFFLYCIVLYIDTYLSL